MSPRTKPAVLAAAVRAYAEHSTQYAAAAALGIPRCTLQSRLREAAARGITADTPDAPAQPPSAAAADRIFELESQLRTLRARTLTDEYVERKILKLAEDVGNAAPPTWLAKMPRGDARPGVPIALWSDWHWGEVVDPGQINNVNAYNIEIAHRRARRLVERTIYLLRSHVVKPEYPGIVVCLGGDMVTGDIHDELTETNDAPIMPTVVDLFGVLTWALRTLADEFGRVFVVGVTGNHGRITKKPRNKNRNFTNFDWLLYRFLMEAFDGDARVSFMVPNGPDALFRVYGVRYLLTHGDQTKGGDGIIGPIGPITRGHKRKAARNSAIDLAYDVMLCGHWHTEFHSARTIVNGTLKGYDEYANAQNFDFEPPRQLLWLTHPEHGITLRMTVHLDDPKPAPAQPWVAWKDA